MSPPLGNVFRASVDDDVLDQLPTGATQVSIECNRKLGLLGRFGPDYRVKHFGDELEELLLGECVQVESLIGIYPV